MAIKTLIKFILKNPVSLIYRINRTTNEFYRAGFISTAISEGIYDVLSKGPTSCKDIQGAIGSDFNQEGLEAWLDFGVSLGELAKSNAGYSIKSAFSKELIKTTNTASSWWFFNFGRPVGINDFMSRERSFDSIDESMGLNDRWLWFFTLSRTCMRSTSRSRIRQCST